MSAQCTYKWSSARSSNDTPLESARHCVLYMERISTGDMGMRHHQLEQMTTTCLPYKIDQSRSFPTSWHCVMTRLAYIKVPKQTLARHHTL